MRPAAAFFAAALLALAGCALEDDGDGPRLPGAGDDAPRSQSGEADAIRAWSRALNAEEYARAASYFADGAIVEQVEEVRLADRDAAIEFNRSLPCKADVTDVQDEGDTLLAVFRLRGGPGGACEGSARVRFLFRDGKFAEWRQLAPTPPVEGEAA